MIKDFKTALLFTTRNLKDSEIAYLKSKSNVIPSVFPIGYDGLAFIVNKNNTDTCITVNESYYSYRLILSFRYVQLLMHRSQHLLSEMH